MIEEGAQYFFIRLEGKIAAGASAEIDREHLNAEMTDFATLPGWRGMGLAGQLLVRLEQTAYRFGMKTA